MSPTADVKDDQQTKPSIRLRIKDSRIQSYQQQQEAKKSLRRLPVFPAITRSKGMISDQPVNRSNAATFRSPPSSHSVVCAPNQFECTGKDKGRCLHRSNLCDGIKKCFDGYDELFCPDHPEIRRLNNYFDLSKFSHTKITNRKPVYEQEPSRSDNGNLFRFGGKENEGQNMNCQCTCITL